VPQPFSQPALDAIADHSIPYPTTDGQPDTCTAAPSREDEQHEVRLTNLATPTLDTPKIARLLESHLRLPGEPARPDRLRSIDRLRSHDERPDRGSAALGSDGGSQPLAALGAPTGEHITATGGGHAGSETMAALALDVARLVGTFHGRILGIFGMIGRLDGSMKQDDLQAHQTQKGPCSEPNYSATALRSSTGFSAL